MGVCVCVGDVRACVYVWVWVCVHARVCNLCEHVYTRVYAYAYVVGGVSCVCACMRYDVVICVVRGV